MHNLQFNKNNSINITSKVSTCAAKLHNNELHRFGGINSIRGSQRMFQANLMTSILTEYCHPIA
jgi:hypothetical protein